MKDEVTDPNNSLVNSEDSLPQPASSFIPGTAEKIWPQMNADKRGSEQICLRGSQFHLHLVPVIAFLQSVFIRFHPWLILSGKIYGNN